MNLIGIQVAVLNSAATAVEFAINWLLQSTLLISIGLTIASLLRKRGSAVQSVVYRTTLLAVFICPLATWGMKQADISGWSLGLPNGWRLQRTAVYFPIDVSSKALRSAEQPLVPPMQRNDPRLDNDGELSGHLPFGDSLPVAFSRMKDSEPQNLAASSSAAIRFESVRSRVFISIPDALALAALIIWVCVSTALATRLAMSWVQLRSICRQAVNAEAITLKLCNEIASTLRVSSPYVLRSPFILSPCLAGILQPKVLLPEVDRSLSIRDVLIHELAHLSRRDCHWSLFRQIATAVFFFQPLLWVLSRRLEVSAEEVCDDYVVEFGGNRQDYALRLVDIAELGLVQNAPTCVGIVSVRSMLAMRVSRIMDSSRILSTRTRFATWLPILAVGTFLTLLIAMTSPSSISSQVVAQDGNAQEKPPSTSEAPSNRNAIGDQNVPTSIETRSKISMTAAEFNRLDKQEQQSIIVSAFEERIMSFNNTYYEIDEVMAWYENANGVPGNLLEQPQLARKMKRWVIGDSFKNETSLLPNGNGKQSNAISIVAVNAIEGIGRISTVVLNGERPNWGQVQNANRSFLLSDRYLFWLMGKQAESPREGQETLFPYLLDHRDEFEITVLVDENRIQLSFPWQTTWAQQPGGKRVYLLDPVKGFLPVKCNSRFDDPPNAARPIPMWRIENFTVLESQLIGNVWMPTKIIEEQGASSVPEKITVIETKVNEVKLGKVVPADINVPFIDGMQITDVIEGIQYTSDENGKPKGPIQPAVGYTRSPRTDTQIRDYSKTNGTGDTFPTMASSLRDADRELIAKWEAERLAKLQVNEERLKPLVEAANLLNLSPKLSEEIRIGTALRILREFKLDDDGAIGVTAMRALIEIGEAAVPALISELDETDREETIRAIAFTFRAIGDVRAVPSLIRSIPKTLLLPSNDGPIVDVRFIISQGRLQLRRSVREVVGALERLTGVSVSEAPLWSVRLRQDSRRAAMQRNIYAKHAQLWQNWWERHWHELTSDAAYQKVELSIAERPIPPIDTLGARSRVVRTVSGMTLSPSTETNEFDWHFLDLDTGLICKAPESLRDDNTQIGPKDLRDWALENGFDLRCTLRRSSNGVLTYVLQSFDLQAWEISQQDLLSIETTVTNGILPKGNKVDDFLMHFDAESKHYVADSNAAFVYQTREGNLGVVEITNRILNSERTSELMTAGGPASSRNPSSGNSGFHKGVMFNLQVIIPSQ